eukprot:4945074-Pyramimonas_sp.AAC.1
MELLKNELGPSWDVWFWKVDASRHSLPQQRERIYLVGRLAMRFKRHHPEFNPETIMIKRISLRQILDPTLPSQTHKLTEIMTKNLENYKLAATRSLSLPTMEFGDVVLVCDLSRGFDKVRRPSWELDVTPTIMTHNELWVWGLSPTLPRYDRKITSYERAMLQGFAQDIVDRFDSFKAANRAIGNAMAVPDIGLVVACLLADLIAWRPALPDA